MPNARPNIASHVAELAISRSKEGHRRFFSIGIDLAPAAVEQETMIELNRTQRAVLIDKLPDAANVAIGALFFAQFLGERAFSGVQGAFGIAMWLVLIACAVALGTKGDS